MKNILFVLTIMFFTYGSKIKGQQISYNVVPATCATCCNGAFTMTVLYTTSFAFLSTPTLALSSWSINVLTFNNVCNGTYTIHIVGSDVIEDVYDILTLPTPTGIRTETKNEAEIVFFQTPPPNNYLPIIRAKKLSK